MLTLMIVGSDNDFIPESLICNWSFDCCTNRYVSNICFEIGFGDLVFNCKLFLSIDGRDKEICFVCFLDSESW